MIATWLLTIAAGAVVLVLGASFAGEGSTEARDLAPCGPSERLPCRVDRAGMTLVAAIGGDGKRVVVPAGIYDKRLVRSVNRRPRPCFDGADAC